MAGYSRWSTLNDLGHYFYQKGKISLAYICFTNSVNIRPSQPDIINILVQIDEAAQPKKFQNIRDIQCSVSVLMPTFNRGNEISASIRSVLAQSFHDFELIVINDGGEDISHVIKRFDTKKIKYVSLPKNVGLAGALNVGIGRASGRYITYLDDDDVYYPNHLELLAGYLNVHPEVDVVYANAWHCYGSLKDGKFIETHRDVKDSRPDMFDRQLLLKGNYISTLNVMYRRQCLNHVGLFNEDLPKLMDWDHLVRMSACCRFHQMDDMTGEYRWKQNNMSLTTGEMKFYGSLLYDFYQNPVPLLFQWKKAVAEHNEQQACILLAELTDRYETFIEKGPIAAEIMELLPSLDRKSVHKMLKKILSDYFSYDPRGCLYKLMQLRKYGLLVGLAQQLPSFLAKRYLRKC